MNDKEKKKNNLISDSYEKGFRIMEQNFRNSMLKRRW